MSTVKQTLATLLAIFFLTSLAAQDSTAVTDSKSGREKRAERRSEKQRRRDAIIRQEEEGLLTYSRQNIFALQLRTDGYGLFFEHGRNKTPRKTATYLFELTETKHPKEEKSVNSSGIFSNSFVYGKINNLYSAKLGYGQQYILGQKGNKNGVAVMAIYQGGLAMGLLRPYYVQVNESGGGRDIKYESADSALFLSGPILGASGIRKGWSELEVVPGAFAKLALRFDFGQYNEIVKGVQIGVTAEAYSKEIPMLVGSKPERFFYNINFALLFGRRK